MNKSRRQARGIPQTLSTKLEEGNYYEALQLYRTLQSRYEASEKYMEADAITLDGILNMNKYGQTISAYDLAVVYITSIKTRNSPFSTMIGNNLIDILKSFPVGEEKEKLISVFTQWCHSTGNALIGYPKLNVYVAQYFREKGDYANASNFYLISEEMGEYAQMVLEWASTGYASEIDLFVTRSVLWLAQKKNLRDANLLFSHIKQLKESDPEFSKLPLIHYCEFVLETLSRDAAPLYEMLRVKYQSELARDPTLESMVRDIGRDYYNLYPKTDMFSNMLRMFTGM